MITLSQASARVWYENVYAALHSVIGDPCERKAVTQRLLGHYLGYDLNKHVLEEKLEADHTTLQQINHAIERLKDHEPIQYIIGEAPFLSYTLRVNPHVLIPRPETEEMVSAILHDNDLRDKHILDICTGSGCIAIALKKECEKAVVEALDVSTEALVAAKSNATALKAPIHWYRLDLLQDKLPPKQWDIIVSNPPYVPLSEKIVMSHQVVDYEPALALFVPDDNPYLFYEKIASIAPAHLTDGGKVYVEFHEKSAHEVSAIFQQYGFGNVQIYHDLQGKERWLVASL